jgi:hypothetical protein
MSNLMKVTLSIVIAFVLWGIGLAMGAGLQKIDDIEKAFKERIVEHACKIERIQEGNPITICVQPDGRIFYR